MKAAFPLAGGALNAGSTCGVVSGGCLGLALARAGALSSGKPTDVEAVYREFRDYTRWFETHFGSTLCSERTGMDFSSQPGLSDVILMGKMITRCVTHTGRAVDHIVVAVGSAKAPSEGNSAKGLCAAPVLEGMREDTDVRDPDLETASTGLDGGVGLSGGLCGALAAALMVLGGEMGIDPRKAGVIATMKASSEGISRGHEVSGRRTVFSVGTPLVHRFKEEFGSLECREITGRSFSGLEDLRTYLESSAKCDAVKDWCVASGRPTTRR